MLNSLTPFDKVYRGIFKAIYEGRLLPGHRLSAPRMMQEFSVGRGTVREALNRLLAAGVITMARNHSATVRLFSREEMLDLLDIVGALLRLAAQRAARRLDEVDTRLQIEEIYDEIQSAIGSGDLDRFTLAREAYYRAILATAGNQELIRLFPAIHVHLMRLQLRDDPPVAQSAQLADYQALTKLLLSGDAIGAGEAAAMHVWHMTDAIRNLPDYFFSKAADPGTLPSIAPF